MLSCTRVVCVCVCVCVCVADLPSSLSVANAKADERSSHTAAVLLGRLMEEPSGPVAPGTALALQRAALDALMRCVVSVPREDPGVLALPAPKLPPFALAPVGPHTLTMCGRSKLYGQDAAPVLAGLSFASFSMLAALQVSVCARAPGSLLVVCESAHV